MDANNNLLVRVSSCGLESCRTGTSTAAEAEQAYLAGVYRGFLAALLAPIMQTGDDGLPVQVAFCWPTSDEVTFSLAMVVIFPGVMALYYTGVLY